ncbi:MAG: trypsin-like peptidase domain-containing protein [candidate division WOR-3 bacterium]|nr:MAG: trypsin-like peptidase domain-containing protein [candidate division WOR-3 bacterium]
MKKRDYILIVVGIAIGLGAVYLYGRFRHRPDNFYYENARLVSLTDDISTGRANAIVVAAQKVSPSVVSITVVQTKVVSTSPLRSPFADDFFRDFFGDFFPERYYRQQIRSLGTGLIISPDGYVVTNEHVTTNATQINITLPDGRQYEARIIAGDVVHDLALLKIEDNDLPYAELGNSDGLMIGEWVVAFGNPFGFLLEDTRPTVTVGVVSALGRSIKSTREDRVYKNMIQTDAAINPGNSGGPLVNVLGEVVGLNTAIFTSGGGSEGIGFARPINDVKKFINEARQHGKVRVPWIGLWTKEVGDEASVVSSGERRGILIDGVDEGSAAHKAGVKDGDRILAANDRVMQRITDWNRLVSNAYVGDRLRLSIERGNDTVNVEFIVEEFREANGLETRVVAYGIHVQDIDRNLYRKYGLSYVEGVVVTKVDSKSAGDRLGIVPGDVVLMVSNMRIRKKSDFQRAMRAQRDINIIIDRNGRIIQLYLGV